MDARFVMSEELSGFPELSPLGNRLEMLRIQRGLSKQHLARYAGTSRQQLWRVMTGKSELTFALRSRLAAALGVPAAELDEWPVSATTTSVARGAAAVPNIDFSGYAADPAAITRTLSTLPSGDAGLALKRRLLDAIEDRALADGVRLDAAFFDLRRRVVARDL